MGILSMSESEIERLKYDSQLEYEDIVTLVNHPEWRSFSEHIKKWVFETISEGQPAYGSSDSEFEY